MQIIRLKIGNYLFLSKLFLCILFILTSCTRKDNIESITHFANIYGAVRWFSPSDECKKIDWNNFAKYGVEKTSKAQNLEELEKILLELYTPIVPHFDIVSDTLSNNSANNIVGVPIRWEHYGVDLGEGSNYYSSIRSNRNNTSTNLSRYPFVAHVPITLENIDSLSFNFDIKAESTDQDFNAYITFQGYESGIGYEHLFRNGSHKACNLSTQWINNNITTDFNSKYHKVFIGFFTTGKGVLDIRDIKVYAYSKDSETKIQIPFNNDMFRVYSQLYNVNITDSEISISQKEKLFNYKDNREFYYYKLSDNKYVRIPVILFGDKNNTFPILDTNNVQALIDKINHFECDKKEEQIADIVVAWNVIKYFYPYLQELNLAWDKELVNAILHVYNEKNIGDKALKRMLAKIKDAHVYCYNPSETSNYLSNYILPFSIDKINDSIRVVETFNFSNEVKRGDVVLSFNNEDILKNYNDAASLISGSEQHIRNVIKSQSLITTYNEEQVVDIELIRDGRKMLVQETTIPALDYYSKSNTKLLSYNKSEWKSDSLCYINPANTDLSQINHLLLQDNNKAKIVFDIRNQPKFLIRFLLPIISDHLMYKSTPNTYVPKLVYPGVNDIEAKSKCMIKNNNAEVEDPKTYKYFFLIGNQCISSQEEFLDYVKHYKLAYLIGENTAGVCGRINEMMLPSGLHVIFTGEKYQSLSGEDGYYFINGITPHKTIDEDTDYMDLILELWKK